MGERVVFVRVALGAADGKAEPDGAGGGGAIDGGFGAVELEVGAGLVVLEGIAVEAGRYFLIECGLREEIAGELFDGETVEGDIAVHGVDHPIAVEVGVGAEGVVEVAGAVGEAGEVEPVAAPALAEVRRGEKRVNETLVSVGADVADEGVDGGEVGREAGEVEAETADEGAAVGGG